MRKWILALMLISIAARAGAYTIPYETWLGAYVNDTKVGYLSFKITKAEFEGVQGYKVENYVSNHLMVLGAELTQVVTSFIYTDDKLNPLAEEFMVTSGGKSMTVSARFGKESIECIVSAGSGTSKKSIPIPKGTSLVGDAMFATLDSVPKVGDKYLLHYFNPLTLAIDDLDVKVESQEKMTVGGKEYDTFKITNSSPMGDMTVWQQADGDVVKVSAMMGITMLRQTKDEAKSGIENTGEDFAVMTSIKADKRIENPRGVKLLDVILVGLTDSKMAITDKRQVTTKARGMKDAVRFRIKTVGADAKKSIDRPVGGDEFKDMLASTPYVDHEVGTIKAQAAEIVGNEKNAYTACSKIRAWIHDNVQVRADIGITRSASDVLKSRVGVCRDYAILFAALARSVGIPAKVASGVLYLNGGFYYHAWVECYVGEWVPFDATLTSDFVDATHIKLAEGDAATMFGLAKVIGSLRAEIKGYK